MLTNKATIAKVSTDSLTPNGRALLAQLCADAARIPGVKRATFARQSETLAFVTVEVAAGVAVDDVMAAFGCPERGAGERTGRPDLKHLPVAVMPDTALNLPRIGG